jgi:hypothetical protein
LLVAATAELFKKLKVAEPAARTLKLTIPMTWSPLKVRLTVPLAILTVPLPPVELAAISKALLLKSVEAYCKRLDG